MPLLRTQRYNFGIVGTNPYSKDAEVTQTLARILCSRSTLLSIIPLMLSLWEQEELDSEQLSDLSSKDSRLPASPSSSPQDHIQLQLRVVSMLLLAICTTTIGDGTHTTQLREVTGWEIRMPSITCANRLLRPSWNWNLMVFLSQEPKRERSTRGPSEVNQRSMERVDLIIFRTGIPYLRSG